MPKSIVDRRIEAVPSLDMPCIPNDREYDHDRVVYMQREDDAKAAWSDLYDNKQCIPVAEMQRLFDHLCSLFAAFDPPEADSSSAVISSQCENCKETPCTRRDLLHVRRLGSVIHFNTVTELLMQYSKKSPVFPPLFEHALSRTVPPADSSACFANAAPECDELKSILAAMPDLASVLDERAIHCIVDSAAMLLLVFRCRGYELAVTPYSPGAAAGMHLTVFADTLAQQLRGDVFFPARDALTEKGLSALSALFSAVLLGRYEYAATVESDTLERLYDWRTMLARALARAQPDVLARYLTEVESGSMCSAWRTFQRMFELLSLLAGSYRVLTPAMHGTFVRPTYPQCAALDDLLPVLCQVLEAAPLPASARTNLFSTGDGNTVQELALQLLLCAPTRVWLRKFVQRVNARKLGATMSALLHQFDRQSTVSTVMQSVTTLLSFAEREGGFDEFLRVVREVVMPRVVYERLCKQNGVFDAKSKCAIERLAAWSVRACAEFPVRIVEADMCVILLHSLLPTHTQSSSAHATALLGKDAGEHMETIHGHMVPHEFAADGGRSMLPSQRQENKHRPEHRHCWGCGGGGSQRKCSGCERALYCSGTCQKRDWKAHKQMCKQWKTRR